MLSYTGHPFRDVGVATVVAFNGKHRPDELTEADLSRISEYMAQAYPQSPLRSFLSIAFTSNAWFIQDAYNPDKPNLSEEKRRQRLEARRMWTERHLMQWSSDADTSETVKDDVFTGEASITVELSGKLEPGRAGRAQIPLIMGDDSINFYAYGESGIPVSGKSLLCFQAMPLGCAKSGGKLLAVHSDNAELMLHFASTFLEMNRKQVQLAQQANSSKMPEPLLKHKTLLVDTLLELETWRRDARADEQPFAITAYHLSNSGQGPGLDIYHLPMQTISFLRDMERDPYRTDWDAIVARAWERAPQKKKRGKKSQEPFQPSRNWLYEDLFRLPENAKQFIRTYFLRMALQHAKSEFDPRVDYSLQAEVNLVSWRITEKFLRRILNMDKERVEQIRAMGDQLAEYVSTQNDRRFFYQFYTLHQYHYLRNALIKANSVHVSSGHSPLVTLDSYIEVFEEGNELARRDWRLARDLVLIRMVERLHEIGWLGKNADVVEDAVETENDVVETQS